MPERWRRLAPVSGRGWAEIDGEAKRTLGLTLGARRLVEWSGPHGDDLCAVATGRLAPGPGGCAHDHAATMYRRLSVPVVDLRAEFSIPRAELEAIDRGARDADLSAVVEAARSIACAEDSLVFNGCADLDIRGVGEASPHPSVQLSDDYAQYPATVAHAVAVLQAAGIGGPYGIAVGPRCYTGIIETTELGGYPVLRHIETVLGGGPIVRAEAVDGAIVMSQRGGDFEIVSGNDLGITYISHDAEKVVLRLDESLTFVDTTPDAAIALQY
ncbi:MAG TPA: family 1 encapsulin nanocompartment shell protein [Acidimicrobiia bacterium]